MNVDQLDFRSAIDGPELSAARRRMLWDYAGLWSFQRLVAGMESASLADLEDVALLNRLETKYVLCEDDLLAALAVLSTCYRVLDIAGNRLHRYVSLYFDTPSFLLFHRHHAGGKHRYKIRAREYTDTNLSFLEVKHKISQIRTIKNRVQTPEFLTRLSPEFNDFILGNFPLATDELEPKLLNAYQRITLVGKYSPERLTIDLDPWFFADTVGKTLPGIAIAEVKYPHANRNSPFMRQMRDMGIRPMGFSKYCIGVSLLYAQVKNNRFRPTLRAVRRLAQGS